MLGKGIFLRSLARQTSCVQFQRPVLARLSSSAPKSNVAKGGGLISYLNKMYGLHEADWNRERDLFQFTRGRFVYDESENLTRRRIQFNMNNLADIAARTIGATRCDKIEKCPDGLYNKAYILTMDNGKEVVGKVLNPNAGVPHYTTASEVATMDFVSRILCVSCTLTYLLFCFRCEMFCRPLCRRYMRGTPEWTKTTPSEQSTSSWRSCLVFL
jgi:hypothetical protein